MTAPTEGRTEPKVGLVCDDPASAEIVIRSLKGTAEVAKLSDPQTTELTKVDALIVWFAEPADPSIRFLARCIKTVPLLPILGMSTLELPIVVELLKCGMTDHMTPPVDAGLLKRKLQRLLSKIPATVLDTPLLGALPQLAD